MHGTSYVYSAQFQYVSFSKVCHSFLHNLQFDMVQGMEIFMITWQDVTKPKEAEKLKLGSVQSGITNIFFSNGLDPFDWFFSSFLITFFFSEMIISKNDSY